VELPADLRYTPQDEWLRVEPDGTTATVGITDYAQDQLGDIVFVELPDLGRRLAHRDAFGVVESVKAVSDLFAPAAGEVIERNDRLSTSPQLINESPYGEGWIIRLRLDGPADLDALLTADAYRAQLPAEPE
jgi:glycine cleavage system H protein